MMRKVLPRKNHRWDEDGLGNRCTRCGCRRATQKRKNKGTRGASIVEAVVYSAKGSGKWGPARPPCAPKAAS